MESLFPYFQVSPRSLFLDMNSYYTSIEQQECERYRGQPTIVVPILTDTTCAIAASYEAKSLGIKTGSSVQTAKRLCPWLHVVEARPELYLSYHTRLVEVLRVHFASVRAYSIDEMACRVPASLYKTTKAEEELACAVKTSIRAELGPYLRCSVGIGPNVFLSKIAAERVKPDGLTIYHDQNLPDALFAVKLDDLPGIGPAMKRRLKEAGIETTESLFQASALDLRRIWGSVVGAKWYFMLRGSHEADYQPMLKEGQKRKSLGHSNVLAPEYRTLKGAKSILLDLMARALKRLRVYNLTASAVQVTVRFRRASGVSAWKTPFVTSEGIWTRRSRRHLHANDELTWLRVLRPLFAAIPDLSPSAEPCYVGIVFSELLSVQDVNLNLFKDPVEKMRLGYVLDGLQQKYGETVDIGALHGERGKVPLRIPFGAPDASAKREEE